MILDFGVQLVVEGRVFDLHEELHIRRVGLLGAIGQQEARCAAANDCCDVRYTVHAYQVFLQLLRCAFAFFDGGTLRQPVIHHQLRPRRVREEALRYLAESDDRDAKHDEHDRDRDPAHPDAAVQETAETTIERAVVRVAVGAAFRRFQDHDTEQRRYRDCGHPAQQQGDHDDCVQRTRVLAGRVLRGTDRREREHGDDRRAEQHAEGNDQCTERDALERHALEVHEDEAATDRQEQDEADQQSASETHEEQQYDDDDGHRLQQARNESLDRSFHGIRLHGDDAELHAQRNLASELGHPGLELFTHPDHVAASRCRDTDANGGVAVKTQQLAGRVLVAARHRGDVADVDLRIAARSRDQDVAEVGLGLDHARGVNRDKIGSDCDATRVGYHVLLGQFPRNGLRGDAKL